MRIPTETLVRRYQQNLYAAAFSACRCAQDAEDAVQETFIKYHTTAKEFESEQHIKAWLLRVAINHGKNAAHSFWRRNAQPLEDYINTLTFQEPQDRQVLEAVLALPEKYRLGIHLYYYEDNSLAQISTILGITQAAAKQRLSRGRKLLKSTLMEEWNDDE